MQLDHLFICCDVGAPEAERLLALGLVEGAPNTHPGQGTACRRFCFRNAFLELVWLVDAAAAQSEPARRTGLWERTSRRGRGASPFGIGLRPSAGESEPSFPTWDYRPPYLPDPLSIQVGENSEVLSEPLLFFLSFGRRPDTYPPPRTPPLDHALPWREITRVHIAGPAGEVTSPALAQVLAACSWLNIDAGNEHLLEIAFDHERTDQAIDLRPVLPLVCKW